MKFLNRIVATSLVLVGLTSCGGVGRLVGSVADDVGRGVARNGDDLARTVGKAGDDLPPPKSSLGSADDLPIVPLEETQSFKVVKVEQEPNGLVKVVIKNTKDEIEANLQEVFVDCVTGAITPLGVIAASEESNFVQSTCQQIVEQAQPDASKVRIVKAGDGYANLRSAPSTESSTIAKIPNSTEVKIIEQTQNSSEQLWYKVNVNGQEGWMFSGLLD